MPAKIQELNQQGFTLLEVLIALLVLAIGLLGLAALQTTGLRSNQMATLRTQVTQLAYEISDRMRANVAGSYTTNNINVVTAILKDYELTGCVPAPDPNVNRASDDLSTWCRGVVNLPGGQGKITQVRKAGLDGIANTLDDVVTYDVTVYWDEERTGATGKNCGIDVKVDLRCLQLNVTIPRPIPNA